jgi:hypothetical protein
VEPRRLLQEVREVSKLADPLNPSTVTQRAFDAARSASSDYAHLPLARDIARQLRWSWGTVLETAHMSATTKAKRLGARDLKHQDWLTSDYIAYVLKLVARRLEKPTVTTHQYDAERKLMLAANKKNWLHGRQLRLPTAGQIVLFTRVELYGTRSLGTSYVNTWDRALTLAGLELAENRNRKTTAQPLPAMELLERYYAQHGEQPTQRRFWKFAQENDLPYVMITAQQKWGEVIQAWKQQRETKGLPAPAPAQPTTTGEHSIALMRVPRRPRHNYTSRWKNHERCLDILIRYLEQLPAKEHATTNSYEVWATSQTDPAPSLPAFKQHGGWGTMLELAYKKMLTKSTPPKRTAQSTRAPTQKPRSAQHPE